MKPITVRLFNGQTAQVDKTLYGESKRVRIETAEVELQLNKAERNDLESTGKPEDDPMTYFLEGNMLTGITTVSAPISKTVIIAYQLCTEKGDWHGVYMFKAQIVTELKPDGKLNAMVRGDILVCPVPSPKEKKAA